MINRAAVVLKPKRPYLDWTKQDDGTGIAESVFQSMHDEPTVYLLPECEDPDSEKHVLAEYWPALFEAMLEGWLRDESMWPRNRTFQMFEEWFEIQLSYVVRDLDLDEEIEYLE